MAIESGVQTTGRDEAEGDRFSSLREKLNSCVIGDILDLLGHTRQFLPPEVVGLTPQMVVVGRAMPVRILDVLGRGKKPYGMLTEALDQLERGEVYLARGGLVPAAAWGELLTMTARIRGAAGAVIDGYHRDTAKVLDFDWPLFSRGAYGQDAGPRNSVAEYRVPLRIGDVVVEPGDLVFGDRDGVVIVPADVEAEVLERALQKARAESEVRAAIEGGMSATDAFAHFGIL